MGIAIRLTNLSVMGNNLATAARYTTTLVSSGKERPLRPKYILEGEYLHRTSTQEYPQKLIDKPHTDLSKCSNPTIHWS